MSTARVTIRFHVHGARAFNRSLKRVIRKLERRPQPLCIDGQEYRRRQRARKRRRR